MQGLADMRIVLRRAGYRLDDEKSVLLGTMAFQMAAMIQLSLLDAPGRRGRPRMGRNDPCHCGSGRKYKKCCLKRDRQAPEPRAGRGGPVPDPTLVPVMTDSDAVLRDMQTLADLFESDPELIRLRFPRRALGRHLQAAMDAEPPPKGGEDKWLDKVACRYVRADAQAVGMVSGLRETFVQVAVRHRDNPDTLRSLALGSVFSLLSRADSEDPDPLACMIFRLSLDERLRAAVEVDRMMERMGGVDETTRDRLLAGDPELVERLHQVAEALDPDAKAALRATFDEELDELSASIREGSFPVPLPYVCFLLFLSRLPSLDRKATTKELGDAFKRTIDELDPEVPRLYGELLDVWLAQDDGTDPAITRRVSFVRGLIASDGFASVAGELLLGTLRTGKCSGIQGEQELADEVGEDLLSPAYLDGYAELLAHQGYPSLAHIARQVAESAPGGLSGKDRNSPGKAGSFDQLDLF